MQIQRNGPTLSPLSKTTVVPIHLLPSHTQKAIARQWLTYGLSWQRMRSPRGFLSLRKILLAWILPITLSGSCLQGNWSVGRRTLISGSQVIQSECPLLAQCRFGWRASMARWRLPQTPQKLSDLVTPLFAPPIRILSWTLHLKAPPPSNRFPPPLSPTQRTLLPRPNVRQRREKLSRLVLPAMACAPLLPLGCRASLLRKAVAGGCQK